MPPHHHPPGALQVGEGGGEGQGTYPRKDPAIALPLPHPEGGAVVVVGGLAVEEEDLGVGGMATAVVEAV